MTAFFNNILTYQFALTFVALLICLFGYGIPNYRTNNIGFSILWFLAAVICLIVCIKIAFGV